MSRQLSDDDMAMLREVAGGDPAMLVAARRGIANNSVSSRLASIAGKLGFRFQSTPHLIAECYRRGVLTDCACEAGHAYRVRLTDTTVNGPLTGRELDVLVGIARGQSNTEIGADLYVGENTVKSHIHRLLGHLGATNRAHAVAIAYESGLIGIPATNVADLAAVELARTERDNALVQARETRVEISRQVVEISRLRALLDQHVEHGATVAEHLTAVRGQLIDLLTSILGTAPTGDDLAGDVDHAIDLLIAAGDDLAEAIERGEHRHQYPRPAPDEPIGPCACGKPFPTPGQQPDLSTARGAA